MYLPTYLHCIILHSAPKLEKYCRKTPSSSSLLQKIFMKSQCKLYNFSELHFSRILVHSDLYINGRYLDRRMCKCYCLNSWNDDVFFQFIHFIWILYISSFIFREIDNKRISLSHHPIIWFQDLFCYMLAPRIIAWRWIFTPCVWNWSKRQAASFL